MKPAKTQRLSEMEPRIARQRMNELEAAIPILRLARSALLSLELTDDSLVRTIDSLTRELNYLRERANVPIFPRERPKFHPRAKEDIPQYNVYLDECGTRDPKPQIGFPLLVLSAVAIERGYYEQNLCPRADALKRKYWPTRTDVAFHEPDMRQRQGKFAFNGNLEKQEDFYEDYRQFIAEAEFVCAASVLHKSKLSALYNTGQVDQYLPRDIYAIAYDHLLETTCHMLHYECDNAVGALYPEATQRKHDAALQLEHARIFLRGTRKVSGAWFQHQIRPGLTFFKKPDVLGIEIADTVSRTVAEHALRRGEHTRLWQEIRGKLYCGDTWSTKWGRYTLYPPWQEKNAPGDFAPDAPFGTQPKLNSIIPENRRECDEVREK